ncbi:MAG: hypothetical protein ACJ735_07485 [Actinomycetes bacterium]
MAPRALAFLQKSVVLRDAQEHVNALALLARTLEATNLRRASLYVEQLREEPAFIEHAETMAEGLRESGLARELINEPQVQNGNRQERVARLALLLFIAAGGSSLIVVGVLNESVEKTAGYVVGVLALFLYLAEKVLTSDG